MEICRTPKETNAACRDLRRSGTLGLVPTMGALHQGHLSLISAAKTANDTVAVSIFVNPTQFGPNEDYEAYPRDFDADRRKLEEAGVDLLFAPSPADMYPPGNTTYIDVGDLGSRLDGASRPGHFRGVATIVSRLFNIVQPDRAYFGQKDAAQVAVLCRMVRDLNIPVEMIVRPIFREPDGLAMSSRNAYLNPDERRRATVLYRALRTAENCASAGETCAHALRSIMLTVFARDPGLRLDYAAVVNPETLLPLEDTGAGALLAVAAWVGKTRLIDNLLLPSR